MAKLEKVDLGSSYQGVSATTLQNYDSIRTSIQKGVDTKNARIAAEDAEIQRAAAETEKVLRDAQRTAANNNSEVNRTAVDYAQAASQKMLAMTNLYKSGRMKSNEFLTGRANIDKGAESVNYIINNIDAKRKEVMARMETNMEGSESLSQAQELEQYIGAQLGGFGNFNQNNIIVSDNGQTFFAKADGNGGISTNPADFTEVSGAVSQMQIKYDNFDLASFSSGIAEDLAKVDLGFRHGMYSSVSDALQKSPRKKHIDKFINDKWGELSSNVYNVTSIISDQMEGFEGYTMDKATADSNPNMILIKKNSAGTGGSYDGVDEDHKNFKAWKEKAKEKYESEIIAQVDRKTVARAKTQNKFNKDQYEVTQAKDQKVQLTGMLGSVFNSGLVPNGMGGMVPDIAAMNAAVGQLEGIAVDRPDGKKTEINKVERTNTGIRMTVTDIVIDETIDESTGLVKTNKIEKPRVREITFKDMDNDNFVKTLYTHIYGEVLPAEIMNAYKRSPGYADIDQNKASQFMQNDGSGRTFISEDEASNSTLPFFMNYMGDMNTGTGTSNATTGFKFGDLNSGLSGATGQQGVTGAAGTPTQ
jgi:hypothetical protein